MIVEDRFFHGLTHFGQAVPERVLVQPGGQQFGRPCRWANLVTLACNLGAGQKSLTSILGLPTSAAHLLDQLITGWLDSCASLSASSIMSSGNSWAPASTMRMLSLVPAATSSRLLLFHLLDWWG